jgi:phosphatidate cytidylyltransferase
MSGNQAEVGTRVRTALWLVGFLFIILATKAVVPAFGLPLAIGVAECCLLIATYELYNLLRLRVGRIGGAAVTIPLASVHLSFSYLLISNGPSISGYAGGWAIVACAAGIYCLGGVAGALFHRSGGLHDIEVLVVGTLVAAWLILLGGGGLLLAVWDPSLWFLLVVIGAVALNDIAAYFGGRAVGGPKVAPLVSPGKTVSGSIIGLVTGAIILVLAQIIAGPLVAESGSWFGKVGCAIFLIAGAQVGDLSKSLLKRGSNVKDSGTLFPGHGGMLDRLDGILGGFAAWIIWRAGLLLWGSAIAPFVGGPS